MDLLPNEDIIYFGDTAHLPYGEKSIPAIQSYSIKITNFLLSQNCKLILMACNTASAAAYELVSEYVSNKALIINVIDPVVEYLSRDFVRQHIGLIATKATVASGSYQQKARSKGITKFSALATPLLASAIEEGFFNNSVSAALLEKYLKDSRLTGIEVLVLGCTHYPLVKGEIEAFFDRKVKVVDGGLLVAESVKQKLGEANLLNQRKERGSFSCYVSDLTESFEASTEIFLGERVKLHQLLLE
jgi:glutamate racemase